MQSGLIPKPADAEQAVAEAGASTGQPLPDRVRKRFEKSLGTDLSRVRLHGGPASHKAANAVGARAYTIGQDIHFAENELATDEAGLHLLAHEVAHTVQQAGGSAQGRQHKLAVSGPGDAFEHEADRAADAMVRGEPTTIEGAPRVIAREPAKGPSQLLSVDDKAFMKSQVGLLAGAKGNVDALADGITKFVGVAEGVFTGMEESFQATARLYDDAEKAVNTMLRRAKKAADGRSAVVSQLLDAAMGPIANKIGALMQKQFAAGNQAIHDALVNWPDSVSLPGATTGSLMPELGDIADGAAGKLQGAVQDKVGGAVKQTATGTSGDGSTVQGPDQESAFWQAIAGHRKKISSVTRMAASSMKAATRIGEVSGAISTVLSIGRSRPDYSLDQMAADAQALSAGADGLAAAGKRVRGLEGSFKSSLALMKAAAPDRREIQKRLVQDFLAQYRSNVDLLTEETAKQFLEHRDFFVQLGIDVSELDSLMNAHQEDVARALARAHQMITERSGQSITMNGRPGWVNSVELPGLPPLPGSLDAGGIGHVDRVRATVVGAQAIKTATPDDLKGITAAIDVRARHLLENRFVRVLLRSYEEVKEGGEQDE